MYIFAALNFPPSILNKAFLPAVYPIAGLELVHVESFSSIRPLRNDGETAPIPQPAAPQPVAPQPVAPQPEVAQAENVQASVCKVCGNPLADGDLFCSQCGTKKE
jgi:hypothetical protein